MTAKEKAEELVNRFKSFAYRDEHDLTTRKRSEQTNLENAIDCALIAVDEMLQIEKKYSNFGEYEFLQEVKLEIESL